MYKLFYNQFGEVDAINRTTDGATIPWNNQTQAFDEEHPLVIELRQWEAENEPLDLSNQAVPAISIEQHKQQKQQEIINIAKFEQEALVADYAPAEQASWDRKVAESKAILQSNNLADAPILEVEAKVFSQATSEPDILAATLFLAGEILNKSNQLYAASAAIAGKRSRLWNAIAQAEAIESVELISWDVK